MTQRGENANAVSLKKPEARLKGFIDNFFVFGYSHTPRPSDAIVSIAAAANKVPFPPQGRGDLVIRSVSAKQRARRRTA